MSYKITDTIIVDNNKNISSIGTALFAGPVIIGGGNSTGTVSQPLQVTGTNGAYIGGNLGIGSTNPSSKLWVSGDIYNTGIHTAQVLSASKDPGTGIATDFTNSLFGNGWRVSSPGSTTYYKLATLPPGGGGSTFDHLIINGVLGAWTNGNQTPFEITFSNRGSFNYKYVSYGTVRSDVKIIGISTNSSVEIWAQHQASQFTKLVYNIPNSIESIVVSNPTSTTTAPTGTTVFDSSTVTPRFIINESDDVGIGTATPTSKLQVVGDGRFTGVVTATTFIGALTGTATSLSGGGAGNIVYQSGPNTTAFLTNGGSGTVLQSNGVGNAPTWVPAAPSGAVSGITVRDSNNNIVGTSGSITQLTFGTGLSVTGTTGAAGIATITLSSNIVGSALSISGISTFTNSVGIGTTNPTSKLSVVGDVLVSGVVTATTYYGSGANLTGISGGVAISTNTTNQSQYLTYVTGTGTTTGFGITTIGLVFNPSTGNLGIGTTNPTSKLSVVGDVLVSGVVTATTFSGTLSGYASSAGISTNLNGGLAGNIVYQSGPNATAFLTNGGSGTVLQSNGVGNAPTWVPAAPSGAVSGITVRDSNNNIVGTSGSITQLTFGTGLSVTGTTGAAGIATITLSSNIVGSALSISGIATVGFITATNLYVSGVGTFLSSGLKIRNPANTFGYTIAGDAIAADRTLTLPLITGTDTIAVLGLNQTFSGSINFSNTLQAAGGSQVLLAGSASLPHEFGTNQTSANLTFGGTSGSGLITFGRSTASQQTDIQAGITVSGNTKTINFGTGGASGSFTQINVGPTAGVGTVVINSGTNLLVGAATSTGTASQPLQVTGGAYVSGSVGIGTTNPLAPLHVNSTSYHGISGDALLRLVGVGGATYIQSGITATSGSSAPLIFTNIFNANEWARFTSSGNLLVGSATSTGTASQLLQVTGGAYVSGNLGVGATAPAFKADIAGDARVTSTNKMRFGGTAGTTNFYIQYNSTANSLDFVAG